MNGDAQPAQPNGLKELLAQLFRQHPQALARLQQLNQQAERISRYDPARHIAQLGNQYVMQPLTGAVNQGLEYERGQTEDLLRPVLGGAVAQGLTEAGANVVKALPLNAGMAAPEAGLDLDALGLEQQGARATQGGREIPIGQGGPRTQPYYPPYFQNEPPSPVGPPMRVPPGIIQNAPPTMSIEPNAVTHELTNLDALGLQQQGVAAFQPGQQQAQAFTRPYYSTQLLPGSPLRAPRQMRYSGFSRPAPETAPLSGNYGPAPTVPLYMPPYAGMEINKVPPTGQLTGRPWGDEGFGLNPTQKLPPFGTNPLDPPPGAPPPEVRFHGTHDPILELGSPFDYSSYDNLHGPGFHTTTNYDVAGGYAGEPSILNDDEEAMGGPVYQSHEIDPTQRYGEPPKLAKMIDPDGPIPPNVIKRLTSGNTKVSPNWRERMLESPADKEALRMAGYWKDLFMQFTPEELASGKLTVHDVITGRVPLNAYGLQDQRQIAQQFIRELQAEGYEGQQHEGGWITGGVKHDVKIYWDPEARTRPRAPDLPAPSIASQSPEAFKDMISRMTPEQYRAYSKGSRK